MSEVTVTGSCLCGAVKYEVSGEPWRFLHCHCGRCRKATGSGHATNLILKTAGVDWKGTDGGFVRYKLPEAERFGTTFCSHCGSPLPREGAGIVVIPAGSIDSELEVQPQGRIFWGARVSWSCDSGELPVYEEYPTG